MTQTKLLDIIDWHYRFNTKYWDSELMEDHFLWLLNFARTASRIYEHEVPSELLDLLYEKEEFDPKETH